MPDLHALALDGRLAADEADRARAADDYGHLVHRLPQAVVYPASAEDVRRVVRYAAPRLPVAPRGRGHSTQGQAQAAGGLVLDLAGLTALRELGPGEALVEAGSTWRALLRQTLPRGLTPRC